MYLSPLAETQKNIFITLILRTIRELVLLFFKSQLNTRIIHHTFYSLYSTICYRFPRSFSSITYSLICLSEDGSKGNETRVR